MEDGIIRPDFSQARGQDNPNRETRREMKKEAAQQIKRGPSSNQKVNELTKNLDVPATFREVIMIATSVAQDAINNYHQQANPAIVSMSLHIEIIKKLMIEKGFISQEAWDELFTQSVEEFNKQRLEYMKKMQETPEPDDDLTEKVLETGLVGGEDSSMESEETPSQDDPTIPPEE